MDEHLFEEDGLKKMLADKPLLSDPDVIVDVVAKEENIVPAKKEKGLLYSISENPPWSLSFLLGFQHYLLMFGGTVGIPFLIGPSMCFEDKPLVIAELLGTIFFCSGLITFMQTTFGIRLPIVQGGSFSVTAPTIIIMTQRSKIIPCYPLANAVNVSGHNMSSYNTTTGVSSSTDEEWLIRLRLLQGAIMMASLFQLLVGFSGLIGHMLKFIGPLTIAPTIALIGLPLFETASYLCEPQWGIALLVSFCIIVFSQIISHIKVPCGCTKIEIFKLFPVLLAAIVGWILSVVLTFANVFEEGSRARTDYRGTIIQESSWFRFPYPGQWGAPIIDIPSVVGILSGIIVSIVESVGDYYACAFLAGAPSPPKHAINRGIGFEGIGVLLSGAWGTGSGTTSYSQNIAAIGITRVGSLRVVQCGGLFMMILGLFGKVGGFFSTIPSPVIGGILLVVFGLIAAVGLSSLRYVDFSSIRNMVVLGVSLFLGFTIPHWTKQNGHQIDVGNTLANEVLRVLLSINMLVGGGIGCFLDNILPATPEERGMSSWNKVSESPALSDAVASVHVYDPPFLPKKTFSSVFCKYLPFMPYYPDK